jgi:ABC-type polysaccharide/polyol phosphate export permease
VLSGVGVRTKDCAPSQRDKISNKAFNQRPEYPRVTSSAVRIGELMLSRYSNCQRVAKLFSPRLRSLTFALILARLREANQLSLATACISLAHPILATAMMYMVFAERFGAHATSYPLYLLVGISVVTFFANATTTAASTLQINRDLLLNSSVPREAILMAQLSTPTLKFLSEIAVAFCLTMVFQGTTVTALFLLAIIPFLFAFTWGVSVILALASCLVRDIAYFWQISCRLLLFVTPVFYGLDEVSRVTSVCVYWLNPITPFLLAIRGSFSGDITAELMSMVLVHVVLLGSGSLALGLASMSAFESACMERI